MHEHKPTVDLVAFARILPERPRKSLRRAKIVLVINSKKKKIESFEIKLVKIPTFGVKLVTI